MQIDLNKLGMPVVMVLMMMMGTIRYILQIHTQNARTIKAHNWRVLED